MVCQFCGDGDDENGGDVCWLLFLLMLRAHYDPYTFAYIPDIGYFIGSRAIYNYRIKHRHRIAITIFVVHART